MELSRRQTLTVLAVTAAAALPASSAKAATNPEFVYLWMYTSDNGGAFASVRCAVPVVSVTARLFDGIGAEVRRYDLRFTGWDPRNGVWETPPLDARLPLGNYWMEYEATSEDGGVKIQQGDLFLWLEATITATAAPLPITQARRTVTVTGTAVGKHPVTRIVTPIAGTPIGVRVNYASAGLPDPPITIVTTATDGTFTSPLTLDGWATLTVGPGGDPHNTFVRIGPMTQPIQVQVDRYPVRITVGIGATGLDIGESTSVDGLVEELAEGEWRPSAARTLQVLFEPTSSGGVQERYEVTSDGQGRFRLTVTPHTSGAYVATFFGGDFHLAAEARTDYVFVRGPVQFDDHITLEFAPTEFDSQSWLISGVVYTPNIDQMVVVQFRPNVTGAWQELARGIVVWPWNGGQMMRIFFRPPGIGQVRAYAPQANSTQAAASRTFVIRPDLPTTRPQHVPGGQPSAPPRVLEPKRPTHP